MRSGKHLRHSISVPSNPAYSSWSNFLIFRNSSSNLAVNRAEGDFPQHIHEFAEISLVLSGSSEHCIDGFRYPVELGNVVIVTPGSRHGYSRSCNFKRINIQVLRDHYFRTVDMLRKAGFSVKFLSQNRKEILEALAPAEFGEYLRIAKEMEQEWLDFENASSLMLEIKLSELLIKLVRYLCSGNDQVGKNDSHLFETIRYVDENYGSPIPIVRLEEIARMSKRTFVRRFKEATGLSPKQYLLKTRIAQASRTLATGSGKIKEVATACGFDDQNYFTRAFRKFTGITPSEYFGQKRTTN